MRTKFCKCCQRNRLAKNFSKNRSTSTGLSCYCKDCERKRQKVIYKITKKQDRETIITEMHKLKDRFEKLQRRLKNVHIPTK